MTKSCYDVRVPLKVLGTCQNKISIEIFAGMYNGFLPTPYRTASIAKEFSRYSRQDVVEGLKELSGHGFILITKLIVNGKKLNEYCLAQPYSEVGNSSETADEESQKDSDDEIILHHVLSQIASGISYPADKATNRGRRPAASLSKVFSSRREEETTANIKSTNTLYTSTSIFAHAGPRAPVIAPARVREDLPRYDEGFVPPRMQKNQKARFSKLARKNAEKSAREVRRSIKPAVIAPEDEWDKVLEFSDAYQERVKRYKKQPYLTFPPLSTRKKSYGQFLKAAKLAEHLEVGIATFIEAQFFWFHRWFARAPKSWELSGGGGKMPSATRVKVYIALQEEEHGAFAAVISEETRAKKLSQKDMHAYYSRLLTDLLSDGSTEEEALVDFHHVFPQSFLQTRDVYLALVQEGTL